MVRLVRLGLANFNFKSRAEKFSMCTKVSDSNGLMCKIFTVRLSLAWHNNSSCPLIKLTVSCLFADCTTFSGNGNEVTNVTIVKSGKIRFGGQHKLSVLNMVE